MPIVDLHFPVLGSSLASDHGYALYAALAQAVPAVHGAGGAVMVGPIRGLYVGEGRLRLEPHSARLRLRLPAEAIPAVLPLAGRALEVAGDSIRLGVPQVRALVPAPVLAARLVTIKGFTEPGPFLDAVRRQLDALGVDGDARIPLVRQGKHEGKARRHILKVKDRRVVGFGVQVSGLAAADSLKLQEHGLGGRRRMGCGFFLPVRNV